MIKFIMNSVGFATNPCLCKCTLSLNHINNKLLVYTKNKIIPCLNIINVQDRNSIIFYFKNHLNL